MIAAAEAAAVESADSADNEVYSPEARVEAPGKTRYMNPIDGGDGDNVEDVELE